jgi:predicted ATPase/DNA-binding winged helix-turn-helix (wHTH) protein
VGEAEVSPSGAAYSFGPFRLMPGPQLLLDGDKPVRLGSRALEILIVLVERAGETVSKEELFRRVWPNTFVEEGNLRVHVAALRKALGGGQSSSRYVASVPGRGYRFVAQAAVIQTPAQPSAAFVGNDPAHNLPAPLTRMIGRTEVVSRLVAQLSRRRLVTIVGPGGIGKTAVALAVANELAGSFKDRAWFIDLAPLADQALVASRLAALLGVAMRPENPLGGVLARLLDKEMLLVFDNCEHVIDATAALAEGICNAAPGVRILATSREPLRAPGEGVVRVAPLEFPGTAHLNAADALAYPAIQLFVERAAASLEDFELTDADVPSIVETCHRLDGIPLAIELAAGRLDAFGVRGLAAHLDDRFRLRTAGRRTALRRHQTLSATLEWSYDLLSDDQKAVFRRLGVFAGWFTAESAASVVAREGASASEVISVIADLVAKSLVAADVEGPTAHYRLLETTRAYALAKLVEAGEVEHVSRLHAGQYRDLLQRAEAEWKVRPAKDWLAEHGRQIDNVRVALDWAFSAHGDAGIGIALTVATVPLWFQLSLINECRERVEQALASLGAGELRDSGLEMRLHAARGWSLMYTAGPARESGAAWAAAHDLATGLGNLDYRLRSLWGLWAGKMNNGEFTAAHELAEQFSRLGAGSADPADGSIGDRMMGATLHFLGDQPAARRHIERMLARYVARPRRSDIIRYQFDQRVTAKITLTRALWLQGLADQALRTVDSSIEEALSLNHALTLCNTLAQAACPVALLAGDIDRAERFSDMLLQETERHSLDIWHVYATCYRGQVSIRRGDIATGLPLVRAAVEELRGARFVQYYTAFLTALAEGLAAARNVAEALATIDEALALSGQTGEHWSTAEMLRIKAEVLLLGGPDASGPAEEHLVRALELARQQQALAWELRTATSLARLRRNQGRPAEARNQLGSVIERFSEGFDTADLKVARLLMNECRQP